MTDEPTGLPDDCPFCNYDGPSEVVWRGHGGIIAFEPLNPVVPGHMLFINDQRHFEDASKDHVAAARVFAAAADWAGRRGREKGQYQPFNLITSGGAEATQTIFHFHVHYVPRRRGDGLFLPWGHA